MKKKKKLNIDKDLFNIFDNIINTENKLNKIDDIKQIDTSFAKDFNYDYIFNSLSVFQKNCFINLIKIFSIFKKDYDSINMFIHKDKINKELNYFSNKYDNFMVKYSVNNTYEIKNYGIKNYKDFITLIKDSNCTPFWNKKTNQMSKQIYLPVRNYLEKIEPYETFNYKNWFKTQHYIDSSDLNNKELVIDKKNRNFIKKIKNKKTGKMDDLVKSHKIKLFFNSDQRTYFKRLSGAYRYFYNRTISYINNYNKNIKKTYYFIDHKDPNTKIDLDLSKDDPKFIISFYFIRNTIKDNYPKWIEELNVPSHLIDKSINEAVDNYKTCLSKLSKYRTSFKLKNKTKKDKFQTLNIESNMINEKSNSLFYNLKDKTSNKFLFRNLKTSCNFNKYSNICDSSITYNQRLNEFYLNLNFKNLEIPDKNILKNKRICSIDPGIKNFLVIYSQNSIDKIGIGIREKIEKICRDIDIIISKQNKKKTNKFNKSVYKYSYEKRRNLKKALHRKIKYLDNIKDELHNKSIKFLCDNFGKIILPPFETQKMVSNNKIDSRTSRSLLNVSYYKFLSKLKKRCIEYDVELIIRPEYYTSKTCTKCGNIKHDLKNNDVYKCKCCGLKIERDINGARNIMLRNLCN
jgi:transposase